MGISAKIKQIEEDSIKKEDINNRTIRFSGSPWFEPGITAIIGGAGGTGSWLSFLLARQDMELFIFDYDDISEVNMGGQLFHTKQIGKSKVNALIETIGIFSNNFKIQDCGKYEKDSFSNDIVFSGFDNMLARKLMFDNWVRYYEANKQDITKRFVFIDSRCLAEQGEVYLVTPNRINQYYGTLFDDSEVPLEDCSYKATSYCSAMIASIMVAKFNNFITNYKAKEELREIPFSTKYNLPLLNFEMK